MVLYMHVILFFICVNLGLGFTAIPNTPLSIADADAGTAFTCYTQGVDFMLEWDAVQQQWVADTGSMTVTITGGGGTLGAAKAFVSAGSITHIMITNVGENYTSAPTVTISGGGGTGASATAVIDPLTGKLTQINIVNAGNDYDPGTSGMNEMAGLENYIEGFGGSYNPVTDALSIGYNTIDLVVGILLGGFINNTISNMTMSCDWEGTYIQYATPEDEALGLEHPDYNANFGKPINNQVISYFLAGINIIFGLMLFLTVIYFFTGKAFGL